MKLFSTSLNDIFNVIECCCLLRNQDGLFDVFLFYSKANSALKNKQDFLQTFVSDYRQDKALAKLNKKQSTHRKKIKLFIQRGERMTKKNQDEN